MEWLRREIIGHGSFSTVSLATTTTGNSSSAFPPVIAVKSSKAVCSASLQNEKQVLAHLGNCPNIVRCFGDERTVENGEEIYNLFLEYASGGTLADRIRKSGGSLPEFEVRRFTRSIVEGLCHIHANGVSHCDVKLDNILIFGDGEAKIADFGLAKKTEKETRSIAEESRAEIRGTPLYMAPESVNDSVFESPADIWSLGCSVVEMASGKKAWDVEQGTNLMSLLFRIGVGDEIPIIPTELPEEGKDFLQKCFVRDPAKRWTAEMLLDHPFIAVDGNSTDQSSNGEEEEVPAYHYSTDQSSNGEEEEIPAYHYSTAQSSCEEEEDEEEEPSVSPKCPFDFPDWISVQSSVIEPVIVRSPPLGSGESSSPAERIRRIFTEEAPDWSDSCDWVNVR